MSAYEPLGSGVAVAAGGEEHAENAQWPAGPAAAKLTRIHFLLRALPGKPLESPLSSGILYSGVKSLPPRDVRFDALDFRCY